MDESLDTQSQPQSPSFEAHDVTPEMMRVLTPEAQDVLALVAEHMREEHEGATPPFSELVERGKDNRIGAVLIRRNGERVGYAVFSISSMLSTGKTALTVLSRYVRPKFRGTTAYREMIEHLRHLARTRSDGIFLIVANEIDRSPVPFLKAAPINATWIVEV